MLNKNPQPIIVRRSKRRAHAPHGGAWKIAYADFVTAMMAFFLLMWLLGSTATGELQGIAAWFASPAKVTLQGGDSVGTRNNLIQGGGQDLTDSTQGQTHRSNSRSAQQKITNSGQPESTEKKAENKKESERARRDAERLKALRAKIDELITANHLLYEYRAQIRLDLTPDGLQIQIVDNQHRPMFDLGSAKVQPYMHDILHAIGATLGGVENYISLSGHTDATPYLHGDIGYSNWELSADRANASRRELEAAGMPDGKLARVVGLADSDPLELQDPYAAINRRITITVLTQEAYARLLDKRRIDDLPRAPATTSPATSSLSTSSSAPTERPLP